jgi:polyisoprenoid-binding protein YceI
VPRSPFLHIAPPAAALGLGGLRWWSQGSGNTWTATSKQFYVADPDLGWKLDDAHRFWIGLEALAILGAIVVGFAAVAMFVRWRERTRGAPMTRLRALGWAIAIVPLIVPLWAFASGGRPAGAIDRLPEGATAIPASGIEGSLDAPAGAWSVDPRSTLVASIKAGGDTFDARFPASGRVFFDPHDLRAPIAGALAADAAAVDTGISLRTKHAREDYLDAAHFPRIGFDLVRVIAARPDATGAIAFRAAGVVHLRGRDQPVTVGGTLRAGDGAAAARLGLRAPPLLAQADFTLRVHETALADDAGDFDRDEIPVHVSLVLVHE